MKNLKTSCTIKGLKSGRALSVVASSKSKKGFGPKSPAISYVAGAPAIKNEAAGCSIIGTAGNDTLIGTAGNDVICGLNGDDTIYGMGGNDTIYGGGGNDTIYGDGGPAGSSLLPSYLMSSPKTEVANPGDDTMDGGSGADTLVGGPGINPCKGNGTSWDSGDNLDYLSCEDVTPPRVISFSVSPSSVDTRLAAAEFTHTLRIEDDLAGFPACSADGYTSMVNFASVFYRNGGQQNGGNSPQYPQLPDASEYCTGSYNGAVTIINNLTTDNRVLDITMTVKTTFPRFSKLGQWEAVIEMRDMTTNSATSTASGPFNGN